MGRRTFEGLVKTAVERLFAFGLRGWRIGCANVTPGSVPVLMSTRRIITS
jgi:hypothetical protein